MSWHLNKDDIKKSFKAGRLIPFVGAGLSMCVYPFPSWNDLLAKLRLELSDGIERDNFDALDNDPLERAEFFCRVKKHDGQKKLRTEVKSILKAGENGLPANTAEKKEVLKCQRILTDNFNRIYTTNYDRLLEIACKLSGHESFPIFSANSAQVNPRETWCTQHFVSGSPAQQNRVVQITKYHGDYGVQGPADPPSSVVVTEGDYYRRLIDLDTKDVLLMRDLIFYDMLFLGYSFRDMSLKYVFHQITRLLEEVNRDFPKIRTGRLFFITTEKNEAKATYLNVAYGVKTWCIQDCAGSIPHLFNELEFDRSLIKPQGMPQKMQLNEFNHLYKLADNEPLPGWDRMDNLCEVVEDIFDLRKGSSPRGLRPDERQLVEKLAIPKAFSRLRADVMHACYSSFLNEIVT